MHCTQLTGGGEGALPCYLQVMAIAPALLPELLAILRVDEFGAGLQRRALAILHTILEVLQVGQYLCVSRGRGVL